MPARYLDIANDLQRRIDHGEWAPGQRLPGTAALARHYDAGKPIIAEAIGVLELNGRVRVRPRSGTYVLPPTGPRLPVDLGHQVRRNDLGYLFARPSGHWPPVGVPTRGWTACPTEVAAILEVQPGQQVFTRRRAVGPHGRAVQLTTSYYPPDIASGTPVEQADTGPGGVYDRIEQDLGHGPLTWTTQTSARLPTPEEAETLNMSTRLPVLVNTRAAANPAHRVVAVDVAVVDAQLFAVQWDTSRDDTASWPVRPATARNKPSAAPPPPS
jgi:GntR family transcriptional regulator